MKIFRCILPVFIFSLTFLVDLWGETPPAPKDTAVVVLSPAQLRKIAERASSDFMEAQRKNNHKAMLTALLNEAEAWLEMNAVQQADKVLGKASGMVHENEMNTLAGKFYLLKTKA
ncbi:MAG: hypothetical protein GYA22_05715, partial [Bacteroidales bacterium]|nr:hypothetical protein [Bacteroidales bacterium]